LPRVEVKYDGLPSFEVSCFLAKSFVSPQHVTGRVVTTLHGFTESEWNSYLTKPFRLVSDRYREDDFILISNDDHIFGGVDLKFIEMMDLLTRK